MEIAGLSTPVFCGVDWAEDHHDIALVDAGGKQLVKARITDDAAGFAQLTALLTQHGDSEDAPIPVAIETSRGLLVACLRATGRPVFAINPLAVARYRDRHSVTRKKSDAVDAAALANILRTDMAAHRPLPADSELVRAIAVLARAQQDAVWDRGQAHNKRSQLREFYPAILTRRRLQALLKQAGRVRGIQAEADRIHEVFQRDYLHQLPQVESALGQQTAALLRQLNTACHNADQLEEATAQAFDEHPDSPIIRSFPGLGSLTGARVLAEIGDDRTRFANASSLKVYAGSGPGHPGQWQKLRGHEPTGQEPVPGRRRLRVGLRLPRQVTRRQGPLRPPQRSRRPPRRGTAKPVQSLHGRALSLPPERLRLRRSDRLPEPAADTTLRRSSLTLIRVGCLVRGDRVGAGAGAAHRPAHLDAFQNGGETGTVGGLAGREDEGQRMAAAVRRQVHLAGQPATGTAQFGVAETGLATPAQTPTLLTGLVRRLVPVDYRGVLPLWRSPFSSATALSSVSSSSGSSIIPAAWCWGRADMASTLTSPSSACPRAAASAITASISAWKTPHRPTGGTARRRWTRTRIAGACPATDCPYGTATSRRSPVAAGQESDRARPVAATAQSPPTRRP